MSNTESKSKTRRLAMPAASGFVFLIAIYFFVAFIRWEFWWLSGLGAWAIEERVQLAVSTFLLFGVGASMGAMTRSVWEGQS